MFEKGKSGNPKGRPKRGDSLAEQLRKAFTKADRLKVFQRQIDIAANSKDERASTGAAEWLAKHGWPEEGRAPQGKTTVQTDGAGRVTVVHQHLPAEGA